ncbi:MAG TPA: bifunctional diguanylate cyclase/phosphodiesterase, partial [Ktedonobacteraceae bacterium]|nr:bifunctional diguanylate cyclase/phosphodiesterase [Ktedonobacteraceae bacterium]
FGHHLGDTILQEVAERLSKALPKSGMIARLGGDEFALMQPLADKEELHHLVQIIHVALEEPFSIEGHPVQIDVSIGAALYPQHGGDPISLLRKADIAMYIAKHQHKEFALYEVEYEQDSARQLDLIRELRHAVGANEFRLYYQPKVEMKTGRVYGVEALIRWQHPTLGFIPPDQFIPLAEQTGQIMSLSRWVLEEALRQCGAWLQVGIDLEIAVNLSMWDLRDSSLPTTIRALLDQYQVPSRNLRVELTESAAMTDPEHTLEVLKQLAKEGICSSIDDFGTGYSSLAYLKRLIVNELKIDRSFVRHITEEASDETIVRSTVTMAHSLGLKVVVEGVEDEASYNLLARLDCDTAQGYFMARPLPPHELECWLAQRQHHYVQGNQEDCPERSEIAV